MHQYVLAGKGKTLHLAGKLEWYKHDVDDKSIKVSRLQRIKRVNHHVITLDFKNGLPYMPIRPDTDHEWENLAHLNLTSDEELNPSILNNDVHDNNDEWFDVIPSMNDEFSSSLFYQFGNYHKQHIVNSSQFQEKT